MTARAVYTTQQGPHAGLRAVVRRHAAVPWRAPCPEHTRRAFDSIHGLATRHGREVAFDLGCGTGESTLALAAQSPSRLVLGLDRSEHRLRRAAERPRPDNARFVRCDAAHFCALASAAGWNVSHLYILYPNPYPKAGHLRRRWHGHPIFPILTQLPAALELRTNWEIYAREFELSLVELGREAAARRVEQEAPISAFERKYVRRGEGCTAVVSPAPRRPER